MMATQVFVVPRSMPMILPMIRLPPMLIGMSVLQMGISTIESSRARPASRHRYDASPDFGLATATIAGRSTRSASRYPFWNTCTTVLAGSALSTMAIA